jgi:addiction module RelE/StbE family toxin
MKFIPHKKFTKQLKSLPRKIQLRTKERLLLFIQDSHDPVLRNHELLGKYKGFRSINVTGDYRVVFEELEDGSIALLLMIGTHSELYG